MASSFLRMGGEFFKWVGSWLVQSAENNREIVEARKHNFIITALYSDLALGVPLLYLILAIIELSGYIWHPVAVTLYIGMFLFALCIVSISKLQKYEYFNFDALITVLATIAILVSFSQICRHLYLLSGGFFAEQTGYWHWLRFGIANLLEATLFDLPAIYNWQISEIKPVEFWPRTIVFIFRTSLELIVIVAILNQIVTARRNWHKLPIIPLQKNYFTFLLARAGQLITISVWSIPTALCIGMVFSNGLFSESWSAIKLSAPVVFGIWLAWQSIRALRLSGN
jgi:hypothetical protein